MQKKAINGLAGHRWPVTLSRFIRPFLTVALLAGNICAADNSPGAPGKFLRTSGLPPEWQIPLLTYGDRLQKAGKERLLTSGAVTRSGVAVPFQLIHEIPNMVRYQEQAIGNPVSIITFDGNQLAKSVGNPQKQDNDLIETLVYDSPTWFFYLPSTAQGIRKLGSHFRIDGKQTGPYSGPFHDIYLVLLPVKQPGKVKQQQKFYHINSDTHLLDRVTYQDADNTSTKIEIFFENWTTASSNRVPQTVRRLENGTEVLRFNITSIALGPSVADAAFQRP
jgi:hypothetical protein